MDIREFRDRVLRGSSNYDTRVKKKTNEKTLFETAMYTVREHHDDDNAAWMACMALRDPELLTELALGATEFVVSEWALSSRLSDDQLMRIIKDIDKNTGKWRSPLDIEPDDAWGHAMIRSQAARLLRDKGLLIDIALHESDREMKAFYICKIAEQPDALRSYVQQESDLEALMVAAASTADLRMLKRIIRKLDSCAAGRTEPLPVLSFNETTFSMDAIRSHLGSASEKSETKFQWHPWSESQRSTVSRKVEEIWETWDAMTEEERARNQAKQFELSGGSSGVGWERARIVVDGEGSSCRISYIGNSFGDFVRFVDKLEDEEYGYFAWDPEGGVCLWFIARRDPYTYVEIPGFAEGKYLLTETFRDGALKTVDRIEPILKWH